MSISIIHNIEKLTVKVTSKTVRIKKMKKTATERKRDTLIERISSVSLIKPFEKTLTSSDAIDHRS